VRRSGHLSASEAAEALGVSRDTLYAYVSRGLIRSEKSPGSRARRYHAEDVWMLVERKAGRRDPGAAARQALHWGTPILESEISLISEGELFYRGWKVSELARGSTFEDVVALLWGEPGGVFPDAVPALPPGLATVLRAAGRLPPLEGFQMALAAAAAHDPSAWDLAPDSVRGAGARILRLLAAQAVGGTPSRRPLAEVAVRPVVDRRDADRAIRLDVPRAAEHIFRHDGHGLLRVGPRVAFERLRRDPHAEIELAVLPLVPRRDDAVFVLDGLVRVVALHRHRGPRGAGRCQDDKSHNRKNQPRCRSGL